MYPPEPGSNVTGTGTGRVMAKNTTQSTRATAATRRRRSQSPGSTSRCPGRSPRCCRSGSSRSIDLALTLKHVHWNVVGPNFIAVHQMLDPQVAGVQAMVDTTAERIATLGVPPNGLIGYLGKARTWDDYALGRAMSIEHLGALDLVYVGVIEAHRKAADAVEDLDLVTRTCSSVSSATSSSTTGSSGPTWSPTAGRCPRPAHTPRPRRHARR